jgi:hypothetical protein
MLIHRRLQAHFQDIRQTLAVPQLPVLKAAEYAAAKVVYYKAPRKAMPSLIQMAKGEKTDNGYGEDLIELFRGSGEEEMKKQR